MTKEDNGGSENNSNGNKLQILLFLDKQGKEIKVECQQCQHCVEVVPKVGTCDDCQTQYVHWKTLEDASTGYLNYVYRCSGCIGNKQKAIKILKPIVSKNNKEEKDVF